MLEFCGRQDKVWFGALAVSTPGRVEHDEHAGFRGHKLVEGGVREVDNLTRGVRPGLLLRFSGGLRFRVLQEFLDFLDGRGLKHTCSSTPSYTMLKSHITL